jgi:hypothetical protein
VTAIFKPPLAVDVADNMSSRTRPLPLPPLILLLPLLLLLFPKVVVVVVVAAVVGVDSEIFRIGFIGVTPKAVVVVDDDDNDVALVV